jgi:hypothetical protein
MSRRTFDVIGCDEEVAGVVTALLEDATKLVLDLFGALEEDGVDGEEGGRLTVGLPISIINEFVALTEME